MFRRRPDIAFLLAGIAVAAWLRFDAERVLSSLMLLLVCLGGAVILWLRRARRLPPIPLPSDVEGLANLEELRPEEELRFAAALRSWHRDQQREAWREVSAGGPVRLVAGRACLYFMWSSFIAVAVLPPSVVSGASGGEVPAFLVILLPLAFLAVAVAIPLGVRDWRRARRTLAVD